MKPNSNVISLTEKTSRDIEQQGEESVSHCWFVVFVLKPIEDGNKLKGHKGYFLCTVCS